MANGIDSPSPPNGSSSVNGEENLEPPSAKRPRKLLRNSSSSGSGDGTAPVVHPPPLPKVLTSVLSVYDRHSRCQVTEGEYEVVLQGEGGGDGGCNGSVPASPKKNNSTWETINLDNAEKVRHSIC